MIFHLLKRGYAVKKSRFTEEQIAFALKQAETGTRIDEICRKMGISDATFYKWRQKYGGLGPSELRSGSAKLNRSDKCIIGVFSLGKGAGAGGHHEQIIRAA